MTIQEGEIVRASHGDKILILTIHPTDGLVKVQDLDGYGHISYQRKWVVERGRHKNLNRHVLRNGHLTRFGYGNFKSDSYLYRGWRKQIETDPDPHLCFQDYATGVMQGIIPLPHLKGE